MALWISTASTESMNEAHSPWYAVHTRSRHERKVAKELSHRSMEVFLPEYRVWSRRKDRRKQIFRPLFPGYLFVSTLLTPDRRLQILQTPSVVRIVGTGRKPTPVPEHEIASIQLILQASLDASPQPFVENGQLVEVMQGPLRGVVGVVLQSHRQKIVVNVELLGRAVAATLDTDAVQPFLDS